MSPKNTSSLPATHAPTSVRPTTRFSRSRLIACARRGAAALARLTGGPIRVGSLRIDVPDRDTTAEFTAVYSGGQIGGLAVGHAHSPSAQLVANLSAGFTATGGFTGGKLGGASGGAAVEVAPAGCKATKTVAEKSEARGTVSAVSSTSITVAGLTCAVPASLQAKLTGIAVNSRAEVHCQLVNGVNTLTSVSARK